MWEKSGAAFSFAQMKFLLSREDRDVGDPCPFVMNVENRPYLTTLNRKERISVDFGEHRKNIVSDHLAAGITLIADVVINKRRTILSLWRERFGRSISVGVFSPILPRRDQ